MEVDTEANNATKVPDQRYITLTTFQCYVTHVKLLFEI